MADSNKSREGECQTPEMKTPDQIKTPQPPLAPVSNPVVSAERAPRQTILLVEDDRSLRRYLEVMLQKSGYTAITAEDGLEAMKIALTTHVDAVITDAIMPHITGHELCRFLRRNDKLARLPVILLSGLENKASDIAPADRADIYLSKPVTPAELVECLERLL